MTPLPWHTLLTASALGDPRPLSLLGVTVQLTLAVAVAGALAMARRTAGLGSGRAWVRAHVALALALLAILGRNALGPIALPGEPNLALRLLVGVYLGGKLAFYLFLALGTAEILGERPPRGVRLAADLAVLAVAVGAAAWSPALQRSLPLHGLLAAVVAGWSAARLWRAAPAVRTPGARILATTLAAYAALALPYLLGWRYQSAYDPASLWRTAWYVVDRASVPDLVAQFFLGAAMVALLVEQRTEADRRERSQRDALAREGALTERLETLGRVSATVAHELNNPLAVVLGTAEHLHRTVTDPAQRDELALLLREALRCRHVARDLLLFARDSGPAAAPVAVASIAAEAADAVRLHAAAAGVALEMDAATAARVRADASALQQALINLLRNAIDASPRGAAVRLAVAARGGAVTLAVEDAGAGIPPALRARLCEPFFTTKPQGSGTGLGLAIVRGIVAQHGGTLEVISTPERAVGTVFTIRLPALAAAGAPGEAPPEAPASIAARAAALHDAVRDAAGPATAATSADVAATSGASTAPADAPHADAPPADAPHADAPPADAPIVDVPVVDARPADARVADAERPAASDAPPRRALVIDDEPGLRRILERLLARRGYAVTAAANGREATVRLAALPADEVTVLFCDMRMPEMDGRAFGEWLAREHPALVGRLVLLTGDTVTLEVQALAERLGCRLLAKPFRHADIEALLEGDAAAAAAGVATPAA